VGIPATFLGLLVLSAAAVAFMDGADMHLTSGIEIDIAEVVRGEDLDDDVRRGLSRFTALSAGGSFSLTFVAPSGGSIIVVSISLDPGGKSPRRPERDAMVRGGGVLIRGFDFRQIDRLGLSRVSIGRLFSILSR